jgi:hypothetical protein
MTSFTRFAAAAAAAGFVAAPAAAQYSPYAQPYPQTYPQQAYPGYAQPNYGYNQGYAQNPVGAIIDQLLGNRYNVTDRQAVSQCASAAMAQAAAQYGGNGYNNGYGHNGYGNNGYNRGYSNLRVTAISDVQRRNNGLRVRGLMSSGYGGQYGYQNRGYGGGELSFRCNVDYRGAVTNIRITPNNNGYRR